MTANILPQFPQSPGNVFQAQPADITLDLFVDVYSKPENQLRVDMAGYWLAFTSANSTPGCKVSVTFDQQQQAVEMVPGQVYYTQFQYFTVKAQNNNSACGAASFKIGRGANTYYSENSVIVPSTPNGIVCPNISYHNHGEDDLSTNLNAPTNTNPEENFSIENCKGFRVIVTNANASGNQYFLTATIRLWWGRQGSIAVDGTNDIVWYAGNITEDFLCQSYDGTSQSGRLLVSSDYVPAVPHGFVYAQLLNATVQGGDTSELYVSILGA